MNSKLAFEVSKKQQALSPRLATLPISITDISPIRPKLQEQPVLAHWALYLVPSISAPSWAFSALHLPSSSHPPVAGNAHACVTCQLQRGSAAASMEELEDKGEAEMEEDAKAEQSSEVSAHVDVLERVETQQLHAIWKRRVVLEVLDAVEFIVHEDAVRVGVEADVMHLLSSSANST